MKSSLSKNGPRHLRPATHDKFFFGVAYYPEHWPRTRWKRDFELMKAHGVTAIRIGEYAWDVWEPREGEYDFELFDEVIALAAKYDCQVVLGTPTSGPPRWLSHQHPDWLKRTRDGLLIEHTGRMHGSPLAAGFRRASRLVAEALAAHYADNRTVVGWQIDNELNCLCPHDFSDEAARQFPLWLERRYGRIARLNARWGTGFSAQTYGSFAEVPLPLRCRPDRFPPQPGHLMDYTRFMSEATVSFAAEQADILSAANPGWLIFHNGLFPHLDYWAMGRSLDCLGVDLYPGFGGEGVAQRNWTAFKLEQCRAHSGSFVIPELATGGAGSCEHALETPEPGQMRLWAWQCVAHGADGIFHFQWRTARFGQELYWRGVLDQDGLPGRRLRELGIEGREFQRLGPKLIGTVREVRIGILADWEQDENHGAILAPFYPAPRHQAEHLLGALLARHLPVGVVHPADKWDGLDAIILPSFGVISPKLAQRLEAFVRLGGTLLATSGTGRRDDCVQALTVRAPGPLRRVFGAEIIEMGAFRHEPAIELHTTDGTTLRPDIGYEILRTRGAVSVARWAMKPGQESRQPHAASGEAAITERRLGRGRALLVGLWASAANADALASWLCTWLDWKSPCAAPPEVTAVRRKSARRSFLFLLNHSPRPQTVSQLGRGRELIAQRPLAGECELPPYGVAVVEEAR